MNRRRFLMAAPAFLAAPALVRASSIMPVRALPDIYAMHNRYPIIGIDWGSPGYLGGRELAWHWFALEGGNVTAEGYATMDGTVVEMRRLAAP